MKTLLALVLGLTLATTGCQPTEMNARDAIASAKGFLDSEAISHPECATVPGQVCILVNRGNAVKHTALDALAIYCSGEAFNARTGPCQPPTDKTVRDQAASKLRAAIASLDQIVKDIKAIKGGS